MSWLQPIFDFIAKFWPFQIVYSFQRGIRFWCGVDTKEVGPGLYMFLPFCAHIEVVNVKADILRLENQNLTTMDGVPVLVSANVAYEIFDARLSFCAVQSLLNNLADECRTHLARGIRDYEFSALLEEQLELEQSVMASINEAAEEWGVNVTRVGLADFIRTKSLSLAKV